MPRIPHVGICLDGSIVVLGREWPEDRPPFYLVPRPLPQPYGVMFPRLDAYPSMLLRLFKPSESLAENIWMKLGRPEEPPVVRYLIHFYVERQTQKLLPDLAESSNFRAAQLRYDNLWYRFTKVPYGWDIIGIRK